MYFVSNKSNQTCSNQSKPIKLFIIIIMVLSFYYVFNSLYLILMNNEIAGKLAFNKKNELIILEKRVGTY